MNFDLGKFVSSTAEHASACFRAGMQAQQERDHEFAVRVQDISHQLRVMDNDNDDDSRRERMRLINELVSRADAMVGK